MHISRRSILTGSASSVLLSAAGSLPARTKLLTDSKSGFEIWKTVAGPVSRGNGPSNAGPIPADMGFIDVPADHFRSGGSARLPPFRLRFCRFRARRPSGADPVFCLFGGPDWRNDLYLALESGVADDPKWQFIDLITQHSDLVLVDHRGGAGSLFPKLYPLGICPQMPLNRPVSIEERHDYHLRTNQKIIDAWYEMGIDLSNFRTPQLTQDINALRVALGYTSIRLIADSNGTYRARDYLRQFSWHVSSALLFISHAYRKSPDPQHVRRAVSRIDAAIARDTGINSYMTSLSDVLDDVMMMLERENPKVRVKNVAGDGDTEIVLGAQDIIPYFWYRGGEDPAIRDLPGRIWKLRQGNYKDLAEISVYTRLLDGAENSAAELAFSGGSMPTNYAVDRLNAGRQIYLSRELSDGPMSAWPLPHDAQTPFTHNVPITYILGEWDIKTPLEAVETLGEKSSRIHIVGNMAHNCSFDGGGGSFWEKDIIKAYLTNNTILTKSFSSSFNVEAFQA